jgi:hypothetical protein
VSMPKMRQLVCTKSISATYSGFWSLSIALLSQLSPLSEDLLTVLAMAAGHTRTLLCRWYVAHRWYRVISSRRTNAGRGRVSCFLVRCVAVSVYLSLSFLCRVGLS